MDTNNWRPAQGGEPPLDAGDWRTQLQADSRQRIVNKIMETLKRHLPFSGQEGLQELKKIAVRFEEKIYTAATSQSDYLRKISLKMLTMENKSQNTMATPLTSNPSTNSKNPPDPASHSMQSQVNNQGQPLPIPMASNQAQVRQQLLSQNNMAATGVQGSASLTPALPPVTSLNQTTMSNAVGQNSNLQNIQNISGVSQNSVGNSMGQGVPSNIYANSQRQMQGRQQVVPHQQQQQSQNPQHYLYQQQLQQQLLKPKFPQGNSTHSLMQSHIQQQQQQQQQNLLQSTQLQSSQQSVMQHSVMQSAPLSNLQQNQQTSVQQSTQPVLQQHPQANFRQQQQPQQGPIIHQQQTAVQQQQSMLPTQQQQQLMGQQPNATNMQQNQLLGQQNSIPDMQQQQQQQHQQQQQQQRFLGQQNNLSNLQRQQQLMNQQNNLSNMHQQQLGPQSNVASLQQQQQQQQLLGTQSGNSSMQTNQHSVHMMQQSKVPVQQQTQQNLTTLLPNQGQQSQARPLQQQLISQIQSQSGQIQQQLGLQQQPTPLQQDMQQRLQTSGPLLQTHNVVDQQKQLFQSQRAMPETPTTSLDSTAQTGNANTGDWQEEVYQKIKAMKETYLPELSEMYQKIAGKLQLHDSHPQQPKNDQLDKLKIFKTMLEKIITFLQVPKSNIVPGYKDKLGSYEKQIINFLNSNRPRRPGSALQQGQQQLPPPHMHSMQQTQQPQSQITQVQPHENQMNPQMQSMNLQGSVATMQQNNVANLQHNSLSYLSGVSSASQSMINPLQTISSIESGQGNALNSLQQVAVGSLQQNPVSAPQQGNVNSLSSQGGMTALQPNLTPLQSNSNMLQHQHLKQQHEQQTLQSQQLKQQYQQRQMQQQLMQKQQLMQQKQHQQQQHQQQQQLHQQTKHQQPAQMQAQEMPQLHQMNDVNDLKMRQQMGPKSEMLQQHHSASQRSAYHHQQLKSAPFPISSPQLLQAASPQIPQHPSPQIDQQNLLSSLTKAGTPLQSANSPFVVPSPSTPLAPSPMPGESEKVNPGISSLSNAVSNAHQQTTGALVPPQSLAIGTPGISASPLLAEFSSPDGNHGNASAVVSGKSSVSEQPLERLIKVVKSMSPRALSASVSDIGSVISMIDRIAGSAPGNGSRAAVGEDLVAMTKCRLQARNFITQDVTTGTRKMRRHTSAMPLNVVSSAGSINDSLKRLAGSEVSDLESTATSSVKRPKIEANHALLEEIREINQQLIDTVVDISDEDVDLTAAAAATEGGEGTIVKCSFSAVALGPNLKSQYASPQMSPIQPLRLLVPTNYPNCSPILLDKFLIETREYEDLSLKAKSKFSISLRGLSQPMSLGDIAKTWDVCARTVISEFAQQRGGGCFSSKYGTWEDCLSAA
ncbi:mediator of RNA polymerase II transcription subunit 15a-like [Cornus florida]|uniref:mediator of RNA polymerase II transcription subunit 15a-like n=1 Tax=Cornus florida TaxID=4283 RepID=UPI00289AE4EA|nr:mediator of RNA polymerase II transcription subunit 15a-like [Cornus florida]XP_059653685.1 mediator of RNA polymerase II transcription subunit 15a-like [Cornus florida]XP_059653686.1 mediator of RNA polymerase II transcription subunit 15a-like [Cornus florida]XP_059653688.1 mediator of RNA polymerase II transcription subunit 15a-like [Cornus florida]XP_059653689.1 mediator of RNA polymerase II transcription subunit 15a-like [Cornus florida]XP_059653690.1 mediator of RNA polymerase II trans